MFWDSVIGGLKVFTYWQTYVATLEYLVLFLIPMGIVGLLMQTGNRLPRLRSSSRCRRGRLASFVRLLRREQLCKTCTKQFLAKKIASTT
jgi:hypothetical protein